MGPVKLPKKRMSQKYTHNSVSQWTVPCDFILYSQSQMEGTEGTQPPPSPLSGKYCGWGRPGGHVRRTCHQERIQQNKPILFHCDVCSRPSGSSRVWGGGGSTRRLMELVIKSLVYNKWKIQKVQKERRKKSE